MALVDQEAAEHEGRTSVLVTAPTAGTVTAPTLETRQTVTGGRRWPTVRRSASSWKRD